MIPACMMPNWQKQVVHVIGTFFSPLPAACGEKWKMFPQVEVWRLDSRVTRVISNRIFPPVKCWMPRVTTGTVTVTISNLQNTRFHRYSPPIQSNCIFPPYKCWLPALHGHRCYNHQFTKCLSFIPSTDLGRIWFQNDRHTRNLIKCLSRFPLWLWLWPPNWHLFYPIWNLAGWRRSVGVPCQVWDGDTCQRFTCLSCGPVCHSVPHTATVWHTASVTLHLSVMWPGLPGSEVLPPSQSAPLACLLLKPGAVAHQKTRLE